MGGAKNRIRLARSADVEGIIRGDDLERRDFHERSVAGKHCYVAMRSGRLAGFGVLEYTFFEQGFVSLVYVVAALRGQGVGTALMRHLERACRTPKIFTSTNKSNRAMRGLLKKLKYRPSGKIENLDEGDPEWVFFRRLRASAGRTRGASHRR